MKQKHKTVSPGDPRTKQQVASSGDALSPVSNLISGLSLDSGILETKTAEQAIKLLEEVGREKESFAKDRGEIRQRLDDVTNILRQIELKEEKLDNTHNALDTKMEKMDEMIVHLEWEKTRLVRCKKELQNKEDVISERTEKLEKSQATFQNQSDQLAQLMRKQQETKSHLDAREEELGSREEALALRELAVKKGEIALIHREHALKAYEQEIQKQIATYMQNENIIQQRMNGIMNGAMENSLINHSSEFSTQYIPGTATQVNVSFRAAASLEKHTYDAAESNVRIELISLKCFGDEQSSQTTARPLRKRFYRSNEQADLELSRNLLRWIISIFTKVRV